MLISGKLYHTHQDRPSPASKSAAKLGRVGCLEHETAKQYEVAKREEHEATKREEHEERKAPDDRRRDIFVSFVLHSALPWYTQSYLYAPAITEERLCGA